jgi:hypothetical protein
VGCAPYAYFEDISCGVCGDGDCAGEETALTCPDDCATAPEAASAADAPGAAVQRSARADASAEGDSGACGDGVCGDGEDCRVCPVDCGPCVFSGPYTVCHNDALEGPALALTFDDGPTNTTEAVLDLLKK